VHKRKESEKEREYKRDQPGNNRKGHHGCGNCIQEREEEADLKEEKGGRLQGKLRIRNQRGLCKQKLNRRTVNAKSFTYLMHRNRNPLIFL